MDKKVARLSGSLACLALGITLLVACGSGGGRAIYRSARSATPSSSGRPSCTLKTLESGLSTVSSQRVDYGLIVENPCQQVATQMTFTMTAIDSVGGELSGDSIRVPAILPGQRIGLAGHIEHDGLGDAASMKVGTYGQVHWMAVSTFVEDFGNWPKAVVSNISMGARRSDSLALVSFTVESDSDVRALNNPVAYVIVRNHAGKIVGGDRLDVGSGLSVDENTGVWVPTDVDKAKTEVYVVQGSIAW